MHNRKNILNRIISTCLATLLVVLSVGNMNTKAAEYYSEEQYYDCFELGINVASGVIADRYMQNMSLEEKAAQMFLVDCRSDKEAIAVSKNSPGGIILFGGSFRKKNNKTEVIELTDTLQNNSDVPLIIATDEEGGTVVRISSNPNLCSERFKSPQQLYEEGKLQAVVDDTANKDALLLELGVNVNMAPVCDLSINPDDFIYPRSFGQGPYITGDYIATVVNQMKKDNVGSVLKHFPGYGNNGDTHTDICTDTRNLQTFQEADLVPFQAGIMNGADAVLVSHNIVLCMDPDYPASLSPEVHRILREDLNFTGVVITDDLDMDAITLYTDEGNAAVDAVLAGNDFLCCGDFSQHIGAVLSAVEEGTISEDRIEESARRVLMWKVKLNILH